MKIITCISDVNNNRYASGLQKSCNTHKLNLKTILYKKEWISKCIMDKCFLNVLKKMDPNEIVFFTDGYDTFFTAGENEILEKYYQINKEVVFSSEITCSPDNTLKSFYKHHDSEYKYLNTGGFICRVGYIIELYKYMQNLDNYFPHFSRYEYLWTNQYQWTCLYLTNLFDIYIDHHCEIFQTFSSPDHWVYFMKIYNFNFENREAIDLSIHELKDRQNQFKIIHKRLLNVVFNTKPCHLHFNGVLFKHLLYSKYFRGLF